MCYEAMTCIMGVCSYLIHMSSELIRYHHGRQWQRLWGQKCVETSKCGVYRWMLYYVLDRDLQTFPLHLFNAVSQLSAFKKCKQSLKSNQVVVVADFAENYKCRRWSEEQACYYVRKQRNITPTCDSFLWRFWGETGLCSYSVWWFVTWLCRSKVFQVLSQHLSMTYPHISELIIWSDGCSAQYCRAFLSWISRNVLAHTITLPGTSLVPATGKERVMVNQLYASHIWIHP